MKTLRWGPALLACVLFVMFFESARAHDTWFEPLSRNARGDVALALGTGDKFPKHEVGISAELVRTQACRRNAPKAEPVRLRHLRDDTHHSSWRSATGAAADEGWSCWMQMHPIELQVSNENAELYLKEIGASAQLRAHWQALRARGVGWQERYTKTARIEWAAGPGALATQATGTPMDVLMSAPRQPLRAGDTVSFQVLREGQPLADLPVEFVNDVNPLGIWRRTDAQGRVSLPLPLAARWMLRGTDLRVAAHNADFWESQFVTLTFEVMPPSP